MELLKKIFITPSLYVLITLSTWNDMFWCLLFTVHYSSALSRLSLYSVTLLFIFPSSYHIRNTEKYIRWRFSLKRNTLQSVSPRQMVITLPMKCTTALWRMKKNWWFAIPSYILSLLIVGLEMDLMVGISSRLRSDSVMDCGVNVMVMSLITL